MACNYPIPAYRIGDRLGRSVAVVFAVTKGMNILSEFKVPCGQCIGCKLEKSRQWAIRCMHEASLYEENTFITLTYNDAFLPTYNDLDYTDFQKFMKRLRKRFSKRKIRFFMCGEYGEQGRRPHYHACLFNVGFDDKVYLKTTGSGSKLYTSKKLDSLWSDNHGNSMGFTTLGDVTFESAAYVARYVMKKGTSAVKNIYEYVDYETGEVGQCEKEFTRMSLKNGIGYDWYLKFKTDIFPQDICVVNGVATKPPRFYFRKYQEEHAEKAEQISFNRERRAKQNCEDNTEERLIVKERVLEAKLKLLKRQL